jgi:hypothetical protein
MASIKKESVIVETSGGVVSHVEVPAVPNGNWEVIDWDDLEENATEFWARLSEEAQEFIKTNREDDFQTIQERIAQQR